jgi:hypothetical protein
MAIADVLDAEDSSEEEPEASEEQVKSAAANLLSLIQKNPSLKPKVASMLAGK